MPIGIPPFSSPARWYPSSDTNSDSTKRKKEPETARPSKPFVPPDNKKFVRENPSEVATPERAAAYGVSCPVDDAGSSGYAEPVRSSLPAPRDTRPPL